jgi:hypothetical protein
MQRSIAGFFEPNNRLEILCPSNIYNMNMLRQKISLNVPPEIHVEQVDIAEDAILVLLCTEFPEEEMFPSESETFFVMHLR